MAVVVITGASSGIGEAAARELARQGHRLVLAARRAERLAALAAELAPAEVLAVPTDVADPAQIEALANRAVERFGRIDVWINNAGISHKHPWWELSADEIRRMLDTNLTSAIFGARAALGYMLPQGSGHIINVASVAGHIGFKGIYSATKFGLRGHSHGLRRELAPYGIHVSVVSPGFVRTEMTRKARVPMPGPEVVARSIARLIRRPRPEVVVPWYYRLAIAFHHLSPRLVDWALVAFYRRQARRHQERRQAAAG